MKKPVIIRQHSEEDCGAACLASITKYYGYSIKLSKVRELVGTGQMGTTLLGLRRGAEKLGYNARSGKIACDRLDDLKRISLPAIIHWMGFHYVILYKVEGKKCVIGDPATGIRHVSERELLSKWATRVILILTPNLQNLSIEESNEEKITSLFSRVIPYKSIIVSAFVYSIVIGILSLASPFLIQIVTDEVLVRGDEKLLRVVIISVCFLKVFSGCLEWVQSNLISKLSQRVELSISLDFGKKILKLPLKYYETHRSGEITSRLQDIQVINQFITQTIIGLPSDFLISTISFIMMIYYSRVLSLNSIIFALAIVGYTVFILPIIRRRIRESVALETENQGFLVETFSNYITLKTTNSFPEVWEEIQSKISLKGRLSLDVNKIIIFNGIITDLISSVGDISLLLIGSNLVINKELTVGQLLAFNTMNGRFVSLIETCVSLVDEYAFVKTSIDRLNEVMSVPPEEGNTERKSTTKIREDCDIFVEELSYYYTGNTEIFDSLNLKIPGGKVTCLIGESGCGKSTLAKLLSSLYFLKSGNIKYGNLNQSDIAIDCTRSQVVLVPQENHFWSSSIIENFLMASPETNLEAIINVCKISGADSFISNLPNKYHTILGEFGANISVGQRQRLSIARAIINNPPILILDESTSALDPKSEVRVLNSLLNHRKGKTTIIISHRPSVVERGDWIVFMERGKIKLQGETNDIKKQPGHHQAFFS
ncbi:MAG: peptidase domain-containing ABC transporter [Moorea sp. SIO4G2]|nr:peptidase domain-containing ABC transporter [Moorena sp. SIO4G2]